MSTETMKRDLRTKVFKIFLVPIYWTNSIKIMIWLGTVYDQMIDETAEVTVSCYCD